MPTYPCKDGNHLPGATRLLGLIGIKEDLNTVCDICVEGNALVGGDEQNAQLLDERGRMLLQALYTSAIVIYARCFVGGVRTRLDEKHVRQAAGGQADEALNVHRYLMLTRDKHLAHAVSPYEDGILGIIVQPDLSVYELLPGVFKQTAAPSAFRQLHLLATELLVVVNTLIERQHAHVLAKAEALTVNELSALPDAEWIPPDVADLSSRVGDPRQMPEDGAWGYVMLAEVPGDQDPQTAPGPGVTDGPGRQRHSIVVSGMQKDAVWRRIGDNPRFGRA